MKQVFGKTEIRLVKGDITEQDVDAVVNAANSSLAHGGGVAGAIVRRGGHIIQEESDIWVKARGPVPAGSCAITSAGNLAARYVIHAVGPRMGEGQEDEKLENATRSALITADKHRLKSIAFPAVSTGIFGYPADRCAVIMLQTSVSYVREETGIQRILFCLFDDTMLNVFKAALQNIKAG